jgi:hypothetical protein
MIYFDYNKAYLDLLSRSVDEETGEIINPNFREELDLLEMSRNAKLEQVAIDIKNTKLMIETVSKLVDKFQSKLDKLKTRLEFDKAYLDAGLNGEKLKTDLVTAYYSRKDKVEISDESAIPDEFWKVERSVKKTDIKKAIEQGRTIPGACLKDSRYLVVR